MPWVIATLRGQKVYARANESGDLAAHNGKVEIRYKPNDGRKYEARASNLEVADPTPLPDSTCGAAEVVTKPDKAAAKKAAGATHVAAQDAVIAYADGACSGNPGPAGLGVVVIDGPNRVERSEYLGVGTNNIAELTAILRALEEVEADRSFVIYTDSQYSIGVLQKGWKAKANAELIATVKSRLAERSGTRIAYVPGHSGVILNERADALAREAVSTRATRRAVIAGQKSRDP